MILNYLSWQSWIAHSLCSLAFVNTWQPFYVGIGLQAEFSHPPKPPNVVLLAVSTVSLLLATISVHTHIITVKCMKIVSLWCIWLLLRTKVTGNLFVKELVMSRQSCQTLPMQEYNVELLQEMVDVKAANCNTAVQNDSLNLVMCKNVSWCLLPVKFHTVLMICWWSSASHARSWW